MFANSSFSFTWSKTKTTNQKTFFIKLFRIFRRSNDRKKDSCEESCDKSCDECVFRIMSHDQSELFDDILNFFWFLDRNCFRNALQYVEHWSRQSCRITFQGSRHKNYKATHIQYDETLMRHSKIAFSTENCIFLDQLPPTTSDSVKTKNLSSL